MEEKDSERNESRFTQLSYDRRHLVKEVRDGAGNSSRYEYRADGKVISEKRGAWEKRYEYDSAGRIAKIIQKKAGASEAFETSASYTLQGADRVQVFTDGLGNKQVYRYDAWSRLTEQVNAAGESVKRKNTAGAEQQRQKDTSEKRGAAFCFCKVVVNKMQQSVVRDRRKSNS